MALRGLRKIRTWALGLAVASAIGLIVGCGGNGNKAPAPSITGQPQALTVNQGQPAAFPVMVTGTTPLAYHRQKNGSSIFPAAAAGNPAANYQLQHPADRGISCLDITGAMETTFRFSA